MALHRTQRNSWVANFLMLPMISLMKWFSMTLRTASLTSTPFIFAIILRLALTFSAMVGREE